jgi:hypothetical protein
MDFRIGRVTRVVRIPRGGRDVVVNDAVFVNESTPPDVPTTTILWQIGRDVERVDAERMGEDGVWSWRLTTRRGERALLEIRVSGGASSILAEVDVVSGQESPLLGWYSPGQSVLRPVPTIRVAITGTEAYVQMRLRFWRR